MRQILFSAAVCLFGQTAVSFAQSGADNDILLAAHCVGESDGYLIDIIPYASDEDRDLLSSENETRFDELVALVSAEQTDALQTAREEGFAAWQQRKLALQAVAGEMNSPAWQAHVDAALRCQEATIRLRERGLLP